MISTTSRNLEKAAFREELIAYQSAKCPKTAYFSSFLATCRLWVAQRVAYRVNFGHFAPIPARSESLVTLESRLAQRLLAFERLAEAWPKGRTALERPFGHHLPRRLQLTLRAPKRAMPQ